MVFIAGIDVGNYDTKTQNTSTPSSYKKSATQNVLDEESIFYNGVYYAPTNERNNQQLDKTVDDYCIIMSLFGIAKEMLYQIKSENSSLSDAEIQEKINKYTELRLGIGFPAAYMSTYARPTANLFMQKMKNGIQFVYRKSNHTFEFNLKLVNCSTYAQDFTAVAFNKDLEIPNSFNQYYIAGIGGGTLDIIPVINGQPQVDKCDSLERGTTFMYAHIIKTLLHETGKTMEYEAVEAVLFNKPSIIDEKRKKRIFELTEEYVNKTVDEMIHKGMKLSDYPCVFIGGAALLMKPYLQKNPNIVAMEFVEDVRANAVYYAQFAG